ncbi:MAG TPA: hypothetical protein ENF36_04230 [Desulfobacteraceae bacterium]|nr:hypothetical protein [Desulfobacteraceae bacterium]
MTTIGDVVKVYYRKKPAFFARIDSIMPDIKKNWFMVELLILTTPLRKVTWTLREEYINGVPFTMEGNEIRIEPVSPLSIESDSKGSAEPAMRKVSPKNGRKVIPFKRPKKDAKEGA